MQTLVSYLSSPILEELKEQTKTHHQKIEQNFYTASIINQTISREDYAVMLQKFYGFYQPLEIIFSQTQGWKDYNFDIEERKKTALLVKDLTFLTKIEIKNIPICNHLPTTTHFANLLGILYVLEGSTLGGQIILKNLKKSFKFTEEQGGVFFNSYGKQKLGVMWGNFRKLLSQYVENVPENAPLIISTACETFEKLDNWLAKD